MSLARHAVRIYPRHVFASRKATNHLRREWLKKVELLGDRWVLARANFIQRRAA